MASENAEIDEGKAPTNESSATLKDEWCAQLKINLPDKLCGDNEYRKLYQLSSAHCQEHLKRIAPACIDNTCLAMPNELNVQKKHVASRMIGRCIDELLQKYTKDTP